MDVRHRRPAPCRVHVVRVLETVVVSLRGDLDLAEAAAVREQLGELLVAEDVSRLSLDLSKLQFIDSTGVGVLVWALKQSRRFRVELEILDPSEAIRPIFSVLGIDGIMTVRHTDR